MPRRHTSADAAEGPGAEEPGAEERGPGLETGAPDAEATREHGAEEPVAAGESGERAGGGPGGGAGAARRGRVGQEIFQAVERLVGQEGLTRTEAFARIAAETGRRAGTVAANYYRVARREAVAAPRRGRPRGGARRDGSTPVAPGRAGDALDRLRDALEQLKRVLAERERELERLRALDAALRDLLGPTARSRARPRERGR